MSFGFHGEDGHGQNCVSIALVNNILLSFIGIRHFLCIFTHKRVEKRIEFFSRVVVRLRTQNSAESLSFLSSEEKYNYSDGETYLDAKLKEI